MPALPPLTEAGVSVGVVSAVPPGVEDLRKRTADEILLAISPRVRDVINPPLPPVRSAATAVRQVLVEQDDVTRPGLERNRLGWWCRASHVSARQYLECPVLVPQSLEVRDEPDTRNSQIAVVMPGTLADVLRSLGAAGKYRATERTRRRRGERVGEGCAPRRPLGHHRHRREPNSAGAVVQRLENEGISEGVVDLGGK